MKKITKILAMLFALSVLTAITGALATSSGYWLIGISVGIFFGVCAIVYEE